MRLFFYVLLCFVFFSMPVMADKRHEELKKIEADLKAEKAKDRALADKSEALEKKLDQVRDKLVDITSQVQDHEQAVLKLRTSRHETEQEIADTKEKLDKQRTALAQVVMAKYRLERVPPHVLILRPSAPIDMARSFDLLRKAIPEVSQQAEMIKTTFVHLDQLHQTLTQQEEELLAQQKDLQKKQASLEAMVKERQKLVGAIQAEREVSSNRIVSLAGQAKDLHDLLGRLSREAAAREAREARLNDEAKRRGSEPSPVDEDRRKPVARAIVRSLSDWFGKVTGRYRLPVAGDVLTGYGQALPGGGHSQGLKIGAASGAVVTAPADGIVRFAGPFRQYKLLVIVQHGKGEHSLLGGLQELYTNVGARVKAGEPLGKLPKLEGDSTATASLYYERRRNGKAVDPRS